MLGAYSNTYGGVNNPSGGGSTAPCARMGFGVFSPRITVLVNTIHDFVMMPFEVFSTNTITQPTIPS